MRPPREDGGFTVVELLIAMLILIVLTTPLVASFVLGIKTTQTGDQDATNSADAQLLASYLHSDVAGAEEVGVSSACGGAGTFVTLTWSQGGGTRHVAYRAVSDAAAKIDIGAASEVYRLERVECASAAGPAVTTVVVARTMTASPTASCDTSACGSSPQPRVVSLKVTTFGRPATDITARYEFTLTAARKVVP